MTFVTVRKTFISNPKSSGSFKSYGLFQFENGLTYDSSGEIKNPVIKTC